MRLTDAERAMLEGAEGPAVARAMDLLVRYGEALGAERLVETNNVCGTIGATTPFMRDFAARHGGLDAVFSEFNLDSPEVVKVPRARTFTCHLQQGMDPDHAAAMGLGTEMVQLFRRGEAFAAALGVELANTCTPYQVGNLPRRGEHCAWMESSAVVFCNSVLGARTNTEGRESTGAAMLTGRIPYWGLHIPENRRGTHLVEVEAEPADVADWGLFGYYVGEVVQDRIPVIVGVGAPPDLARLKHFGAAASTSGGIELYHIVGVTPEAPTREAAFGGARPAATLRYGRAERRLAYERVNATARRREIQFVMLGCPHYSLEQLREVCRLLAGRRVHPDVELWIFAPRAIRALAVREGIAKIIEDAGGRLMSDTCSAMSRAIPPGTRAAAFDSVKQAHYLPAIMGIEGWFGTTADCIEAAVRGRFEGDLR
ncbi:MAG: aconitase X catalytic domain-containing protein [Burkholderiales bacterium]|nr:aconitase X catalytic domain-containing protein [Burkholderiales bacterium]